MRMVYNNKYWFISIYRILDFSVYSEIFEKGENMKGKKFCGLSSQIISMLLNVNKM